MSAELTKEERQWLRRMRSVAEAKPDTLRAYATDNDVVICKVGVPCTDFTEDTGLEISFGAWLTDLHEDERIRDY